MRKQEDILGGLLGDGAATSEATAALIFLPSLTDRLPVEAVVLVEEVVLAGDHGAGHLRGDPLVGHPGLAGVEILVVAVLDGPLDHQRGDIHRTPAQDKNPEESDGEESQGQLDENKPPEPSPEGAMRLIAHIQ